MWIFGYCAAARGVAAADDEVGVAGVGELEAVGDVLAGHELSEVVHVGFEGYAWHLLAFVVAFGTIGILYDVDSGRFVFAVVACGKE